MIRTAECVTPKHPDKLCDRIADAILTEAIKQDPKRQNGNRSLCRVMAL